MSSIGNRFSGCCGGCLLLGLRRCSMSGCAGTTSAATPLRHRRMLKSRRWNSKDLPIEREWIGTLDGMVNAAIKAQVTGYLLTQNYTEGSFVRKGQLLFRDRPAAVPGRGGSGEGQLAQAKAQLAQAQAPAGAGAGATARAPRPISGRRRWTKTAMFRLRSSRRSRSRIWIMPSKPIESLKAQVAAAKAQVETAKSADRSRARPVSQPPRRRWKRPT